MVSAPRSTEEGCNNNAVPVTKSGNKTRQTVKSKVVLAPPPKLSVVEDKSKHTRSRTIKAPAHFLDHQEEVKVKKKKYDRKSGGSKNLDKSTGNGGANYSQDLSQLYAIDKLSQSEIADDSRAAEVDHDGVELSVNGSDLDEFSDEEDDLRNVAGLDPPRLREEEPSSSSNVDDVQDEIDRNARVQENEPGEILSSDDEESRVVIESQNRQRSVSCDSRVVKERNPTTCQQKGFILEEVSAS